MGVAALCPSYRLLAVNQRRRTFMGPGKPPGGESGLGEVALRSEIVAGSAGAKYSSGPERGGLLPAHQFQGPLVRGQGL